MPFGEKPDANRRYTIDFNDIYKRAIAPALQKFDVEYIRADEERSGGIIHLPMFERLLLAEVGVVDVTIPNPNVYYELGVRHAACPRSTVIIGADDAPLPFDIAGIRTVPYKLTEGRLTDEAAQAFIEAFVPRLEHALGEHDFKDSPIFQLIPALGPYPLPHDVTDSFRQRSHDLNAVRERLAAASRAGKEGKERIGQIEAELGEINQTNAELFVDVLLSYRDVEAFDEMIVLGERLPSWLKSRVPMAEEQVAFALNRRFRLPDRRPDDRDRAIGMLEALIERNGDSPETSSLLARVYKDDYLEAVERGEAARARGSLRRAIELYRRGFDADPRDYYPGINLATLLTLAGTPEALAEFGQVAPAVAFAIRRAGGLTSRNYWLAATALELAVLRGDAEMTRRALDHVATIAMQPWMPKTTLNNLAILQRASDEALNKILLAEATADLTALWEELKARA